MKNREEIKLTKSGEEKMQQLKKDYNSISAPEELYERIEQMKSVKEKKWFQTGVIKVVGGVAAAMLVVTLLANTSENVANAMQKVPVLGTFTQVVTFRTYENAEKNHEARVEVPKVEEDNSSQAAKQVNKSMKEYVDKLIKEHEQNMKMDKEYAKEYKEQYGETLTGHESLDTQYKVLTNNDRLLTVRLDTTIVMASSDVFSKIYHIDKLNDKEVTLKDLFVKDSKYREIISDNIKEQMRNNMKKDENVSYFVDSDMPEMDFDTIKKNQNFYVNKKNQLVLVFDKYEVAPGYMGQVEFTIPTQLLDGQLTALGKDILKVR